MKIVVLGGGDSPEREVSLRSSKSVAEAAVLAGYDISEADPKNGLDFLEGLDKNTIIFPILHGVGGEDGVLQKQLENAGAAYLGSDAKSSADCFDKWVTRLKLQENQVAVPEGRLVDSQSYKQEPLSMTPHVLKVIKGGSSIGTLMVRDPAQADQQKIDDLFAMNHRVLIEKLILGTEITVPILDAKALPVIEIIPPADGEFDYENKYNGQSQELCPPKSVSPDIQEEVQKIAEKVHALMSCRHLSRVDIMLDAQNKPFVLEINTMPGMTSQSLYPKSAKAAGLDMPDLVKKFVGLVKRDYGL